MESLMNRRSLVSIGILVLGIAVVLSATIVAQVPAPLAKPAPAAKAPAPTGKPYMMFNADPKR